MEFEIVVAVFICNRVYAMACHIPTLALTTVSTACDCRMCAYVVYSLATLFMLFILEGKAVRCMH